VVTAAPPYPPPSYTPPAPPYPSPSYTPPAPAYSAAGGNTAVASPYAPPAYDAPTFFDTATGAGTTADPLLGAALFGNQPAGVMAGVAYEVHLVQPGGDTVPVDPALRDFATGERFVVYLRPTLPGRLAVFNINPQGRQSQIDAQELAAGQMKTLGPYEFAAAKGEDRLRLVVTPCSTPQLLLATRDIVNVGNAAPGPGGAASPATAPSFDLVPCAVAGTRSSGTLATRDIRKVAVEGATGFALDPLLPQELSSGRAAPREVTIVFRHR